MRTVKQKFLALVALILIASSLLSACGLDSLENNGISDDARAAFIETLLEGYDILFAPALEEYNIFPSGYSKISRQQGGLNGLKDMTKIAGNSKYELYIDMANTDIAVKDLTTEYVYHSNPSKNPNVTISSKSLEKTLASPLAVEAYDASGKRYSFNFYENCYEDNLFYITKDKNDPSKFRLIYTIGNDPDKDLFPPVITESTWEDKIMKPLNKQLTDGQINQKTYQSYEKLLRDCYRYMTPDDITVEVKERFKTTFPTIDVMTLYVSYDKTSTKQKKAIKEMMKTIGFTVKDVKLEMEKADYQGPERSVLYTIPVDLTLTEEGLTVDVDASKILGPTKQRLYTINMYRGMGAHVSPHGNEYMIVPDGTGALIPATGAASLDSFKTRVYGSDETFSRRLNMDLGQQSLAAYLIFDRGQKQEADNSYSFGGVVALMEHGAGVASAIARAIAGNSYPVATVNYEVVYSERDYRTYSTSTTNPLEQTGSGLLLSKDDVKGVYRVNYLFTPGGMTYSDYATYLRNYYQSKGLLATEVEDKELPLYVDLLGCVDLDESVVGIPVTRKTALTGYSQALQIMKELKEAGVNSVVARYSAWSNGGENNVAANDLELISRMGSKAELQELISYCDENGLGFYPSVDFLKVTSSGNGFSTSQDAARRLNRSTATIVERYPATGFRRHDLPEKILISPAVSLKMAESYKASFEDVISVKKIAMADLGKDIHSSYKTDNVETRLLAEESQRKILEQYADYSVAVSTGNFYTWKDADYIFQLVPGSSEYLMESSSIPFIQMILHGCISYSTEPLNLNGDYETARLYALETGSSPCFRWMGAEDSIFDYTEFYNYYSLHYTDTFDRAVELYKFLSDKLNDVLHQPITSHEQLAAYYCLSEDVAKPGEKLGYLKEGDEGYVEGEYKPAVVRGSCGGVFATTYGDQKVIVVNYNSNDVELEDRTVLKARDYVIMTPAELAAITGGTAYEAIPEPVVEEPDAEDKQEG